MLGRGPAAATDDADAVALHELAERLRERLGLLGEDGLAVGSLQRQPRVRDARDRHGAGFAEEADRVAHVLGAGRAVQADDVHAERLERGEHGGDVGAEQHLAALREQRDGGVDRQRPAGLLERLARAEDRGLHLEDVLRGLDDDQVGAALHEPARLLVEDRHELREADLAERGVFGGGQEPGGTDRSRDEALLAGGAARDLRGLHVDLVRVVGETPLAELQARGLEGVRLDHFGAGVEHRGVHALDHVRAVQDERLVALAGEPAVVLGRQLELLERGPHAAVVDHHMAGDCLSEVAHSRGL